MSTHAGNGSLRRLLIPEFQDLHRTSVDRFVAEAARRVPAGSVLFDAGAGEGMYRHLFAHATYLAADYGIGDAAWDYSALDVVCDLHTLPVRDGSLHFVLCTQTLEHVPRPQAVLCELYRTLDSGGTLFCTLPFLGDAHHQEPHDYFRYTKYAVEYLFRTAGFSSVDIVPFGGYNTLVMSLLLKGVYRFFERRSSWPRLIMAPLSWIWRVLFVGARWMNRIAGSFDGKDPERYRYAMGWGVTGKKEA